MQPYKAQNLVKKVSKKKKYPIVFEENTFYIISFTLWCSVFENMDDKRSFFNVTFVGTLMAHIATDT